MSSYDEIATRIANVILSPESVIGLIHGILSVPLDLGYLAYGYFDTESHYSHETERIRIVRAIDSRILNHDRITDAIQIVFSQFNKYTSENKQNKIYSRTIFSVVGRIATNSVISSKIATAIAQRASFFVAVRGGVMGNILLVGGMTERCIRTSEQLSVDEPEVYNLLRSKDYDLLYFLFEPALKPFIDALSVRRIQGISAFNEILELVEDKVNSYHG
ncbi:hypothetical protein [Yersinia kristensenii]|uniref:Uncharacterized protein n=1 Tax=Yersinia kristensenii TaxID=28152 RepID=A0AB73NHB7_YERKR|nr:hypothetical protein [Yersinia kristensenii]OVZ78396.1 hypothetical protein CBW52_18795 [Yersinia kristensenii]